MRTTIDAAGRVVIPALLRRQAGLAPGTELDIVLDDTSVRLVRRVPGPRLERVGRRLVARVTAKPGKRPKLDVAALVGEERSRWPW
jgi:AbrB family looped-hinge helix DNA binding protein